MAIFLRPPSSSHPLATPPRKFVENRGPINGARHTCGAHFNPISAADRSRLLPRTLAAEFPFARRRKSKSWPPGRGPGICNAGGYGGGANGDDDDEGAAAHLCLFPLQSACLPTATGQLLVHEPRYLQMFEVIMEVARAEMKVAQFGMFHDLRLLDALPPSTAGDGPSNDIHIGSCCHVESISDSVGEGLVVKYKCVGRFMVKGVKINRPFHVAHIDWVTDFPSDMPGSSGSGAARDRLEREVWQAVSDVAALTAKLAESRIRPQGGSAAAEGRQVPPGDWLPAAVRQFAPVAFRTLPDPAPNRHVAADIATWRRSGGRRSPVAHAERRVTPETNANPYWSAREKLVKPLRQEAFSFAAASIVEAGVHEKCALLKTRDTAARLSWVLDAVQPYLRKLQAQNSVLEAMERMN